MRVRKYLTSYFNAINSYKYSYKIELFFKGWYAISVIKLLLLGSIFQDVVEFQISMGELSLYGLPRAGVTRWLIILVLVIGILLRRSYASSIVMFLAVLSSHYLLHLVVNGGDLVILYFMFLGIFCNTRPLVKGSSISSSVQSALISFSIIIGQIQIAMVYLVSGWDKLISEAWREGSALFNLLHVDFYATSWIDKLVDDLNPSSLAIISWGVILFELCFPILVWFAKTRYYTLAIGILFHLIIAFGLSLPDFATVMIWAYVLFARDEDFDRFINSIKRLSVTSK